MSSTLLPPHANSFVIGPAVIKHTSYYTLQAPARKRQAWTRADTACHRHAPRLRAAAECAASAQRLPVERKARTLAVSSWRRLPSEVRRACACVLPGRSRKKIRDAKKTQEREVAERITIWRDKKGKQTVSRAEVSRHNRKVRPALTAQGAVAYKEEFTQQKQ